MLLRHDTPKSLLTPNVSSISHWYSITYCVWVCGVCGEWGMGYGARCMVHAHGASCMVYRYKRHSTTSHHTKLQCMVRLTIWLGSALALRNSARSAAWVDFCIMSPLHASQKLQISSRDILPLWGRARMRARSHEGEGHKVGVRIRMSKRCYKLG